MAADLYTSLPLTTPETIRLLHLDETQDGNLTGSCYSVQLSHNPRYDALSYFRGTSTENRFVRCSGCDIPISDSCYMALVHLTKSKKLTIWVDMVCVQQTEVEKQHHVRLTSDIFSQAVNTYLWLGSGSGSNDEAMKFMATGGLRHFFYKDGEPSSGEVAGPLNCFTRLYCWPYILHTRTIKRKPTVCFRSNGVKHFASTYDLARLLQGPWNKRIWTFAETILASNPIVVCGDHQVPWIHFAMTLTYLHHSKALKNLESWNRLILSREYVNPGFMKRYIQLLRELSKRRYTITVLKSWISFLLIILGILLVSFSKTRIGWPYWFIVLVAYWVTFSGDNNLSLCKGSVRIPLYDKEFQNSLHDGVRERTGTDGRDRYHAMQCIFKKLVGQDKVAKTEKDAYRELTACLMEATAAVSLLEAAARARITPTWVPDWSKIGILGILSTVARTANFNATKMSVPPLEQNLNKPKIRGNTITVTGVHLHKIEQLYALQPTQTDYDISEHEIHIQNYRIVHAMIMAGKGRSQYKQYRPARKELRKLKLKAELLAFLDTIWSDETVPKDLPASYLFEYVQHFKYVPVEKIFSDPTITVDTSFWPPWTKSVTNVFRVHLTLCRLMIRHHCVFFGGFDYGNLFANVQRQCYGICLTNAKKGDEVALVEAVTIPIVMRPYTTYELVCPSLAFDLMHGQAWERREVHDEAPDEYFYNRQHQITIS